MNSIKCCHIITSLSVGGAEKMLLKICQQTENNGLNNFVISLKKDGLLLPQFKKNNIIVIPFSLNPFKLRQSIPFKPDIIQGWMYYGNLFCCLLKPFLNRHSVVIWNIRQSLATFKKDRISTKLSVYLSALTSFLPKKIICNSYTAIDHHQKIGFKENNFLMLSNGFETDHFTPKNSIRNKIRTELKLSENSILITSVGRFHPDKDYETFISAAIELIKSNLERETTQEIYFLLIGKDLNQENVQLNNLILEQYKKFFHLLGPQENINDYLSATDIYTSTSIAESFSNSIGEAMSCGLPCVVTDVGDSIKIISDTGYSFKPKDSSELKKLWIKLILDESLRKDLGDLARQRILENYKISVVAEQYMTLYNSYIK